MSDLIDLITKMAVIGFFVGLITSLLGAGFLLGFVLPFIVVLCLFGLLMFGLMLNERDDK